MGGVRITRDFFLWCMSIIYLFAFGSLYVQIPGLFGDNGILPAKNILKEEANSWSDLLDYRPTLLKLTPKLGLSTEMGMELLCLAGVVISFMSLVFKGLRDTISFAFLWMLYLSLYHVGSTFLSFQWDILLLETGFLTILIAPFNIRVFGFKGSHHHQHDSITMWLLKWLLFRVMFASGVVKLTSQCPTWWGLTALQHHFESQCIPTPAAWFWSQFPLWLLKLSVVITYVIEIAIPFLFFSPVRSMRIVAFWLQIVLQVLIMLTGNYNFFNLLTMVLCISLLDDECFVGQKGAKESKKSIFWTVVKLVSNLIFPMVVFGLLGFYVVKLFDLQLTSEYTIQSQVMFDYKTFVKWLKFFMPYTIGLGMLSLGYEILIAVLKCFVEEKGSFRKIWSFIQCAIFTAAACALFAVSIASLSVIEPDTYWRVPSNIREWHERVQRFELTSSYGLFRIMTGVGGRPEVIIEGRNGPKEEWQEYNFLYKPGNISVPPPIVAPHQPRLDWQLWFAALGNYQNNPWFLNLIYRLLTNQPEVMDLMDTNPFPEAPPKLIRARLYHYHFTKDQPEYDGSSSKHWWTRTSYMEYLPEMNKDEPSFVSYLKSSKIIQDKPNSKSTNRVLASFLEFIRGQVRLVEGFTFVMSLFGSGIAVWLLNAFMF